MFLEFRIIRSVLILHIVAHGKPEASRGNFQKQSLGGVFKNFAKFTEKHLSQSLFFDKAATLLKKRLWHKCFPINFEKLLRKRFFYRKPPVTASDFLGEKQIFFKFQNLKRTQFQSRHSTVELFVGIFGVLSI